jgi:hypothetical protein
MDSITKSFALILIGIMAISCMSILMVESVFAQTILRPSVPEFTAKVVDTILEVTIKNQPLTPFENGSYPSLYYMFRFKDNNTKIGYWDYDPMYYVLPSTYGGYHKASDSDFTTVSLSLDNYQYPSGQIDIQVMALIGNQYPTKEQNSTVYAFEGIVGDWTTHQYITIPTSSSSPTPSAFVPAPSLDIIHPQNFTYSGESAKAIPLMIYATVLVDASTVVSISYSLDESQNITFTDLLKTGEFPSQSGKAVAYNTEMLSLSNLTDGTHVLNTYSLDTSGNVMKNTVEFTVDSTPMPTVNPFPHTPQTFPVLVIALILLAVVIALVLIYKRNRKPAEARL